MCVLILQAVRHSLVVLYLGPELIEHQQWLPVMLTCVVYTSLHWQLFATLFVTYSYNIISYNISKWMGVLLMPCYLRTLSESGPSQGPMLPRINRFETFSKAWWVNIWWDRVLVMGSGLVRAVGPQVAMFLCHERGPSLILFQNALESAAVQIRMNWVDQDILRICMVLLYIYIYLYIYSRSIGCES